MCVPVHDKHKTNTKRHGNVLLVMIQTGLTSANIRTSSLLPERTHTHTRSKNMVTPSLPHSCLQQTILKAGTAVQLPFTPGIMAHFVIGLLETQPKSQPKW